MNRHATLLMVAAALAAPACAPKAAIAPAAPAVSVDQKLGWILRLEDRRVLSDPSMATPTPPPASPPRRGAVAPAPIAAPDLLALARDPEARIRRRAALAIGRVGLTEGLPALARLLQDADPEVRAMAAFATGLVLSRDGVSSLTAALSDTSPLVRGRAAEALGIICAPQGGGPQAATSCDPTVAPAIAAMAEGYIASAAAMTGDQETAATPEADAWRLAAYALVRIRDFNSLSRIALADGKPVTSWWPVAYALQRINNAAVVPALAELAQADTVTGAAFAIRGLADHRASQYRPFFTSTALDSSKHVNVRIAAVRALGRLGGADSAATLVKLLAVPKLDDNLKLETVTALGAAGDRSALEPLLDLLSDEWPLIRATVLGIVARLDPENFLFVLSSLGPDPDWSVRAALARLLGALPAETAAARIEELWKDQDARVHGAALAAAVQAKLPGVEAWIREGLQDDGARGAAIAELGRLRPSWGAAALREIYASRAEEPDADTRSSALAALARFGPEASRDTIVAAMSDRDWAVRLQARTLMEAIDPAAATQAAIRPAPSAWPESVYVNPALVSPASSPRMSIETRHGTIEIELDVVHAPLTSGNFLELARKGFFDGVRFHRVVPNFVIQAGEARPEWPSAAAPPSIRDELHPAPFLRGTVGVALAGPDTGSSQFYIMHSPAPHLDARYTVFGRVVSGMEVVDRIRQGDAITRVRVSGS